jgi:hypothetical protein
MSDQLIGDIRAVNMWNWYEPEWDGITLPRPKKELVVTNFEIQVRKIIVTDQGLPALSDWTPIQIFDQYPEAPKSGVII